MTQHFYWLVIGILVTWRIAHLLYGEDGPWNIFVRLRGLAGEGFWGSLLDCFYCLSLWVALLPALWIGENWKERLLLWPALSAAAILLERLTAKDALPPHVLYAKEEEDHVLREEKSGVENNSTD